MRTAKRAWLVFDQLDLAATVMLNGAEIARHCNVFYPCRVEVTGKLRATGNVLAVHVEGGLMWAGNKSIEGYGAASRFDWNLHKRVWLRKPQCQFGWDWSTRLVNVGIVTPERAMQLGGTQNLLPRVLFAEFYARAAADPALFTRTLQDVLAAPETDVPRFRLMNAIARERAARLLHQKDELF